MKLRYFSFLIFIILFNSIQSYGIQLTLTPKNASCGNNNGSIISYFSGGIAPVTFAWSSGQTTQNIYNLAPGNYTLFVTDALGDTASKTEYIGNTPQLMYISTTYLIPNMGGITHPCNSQCNGTAYLYADDINGTPPYSMWTSVGHSIGAYGPTQIPTVLGICSTDNFTVTVGDSYGCIGTSYVHFGYPPSSFDFTPQIIPACNGLANGSIQLILTNTQSQSYSATWTGPSSGSNPNFSFSPVINNLLPGQYNFTIRNDYGTSPCDTLVTITVPNLGFNCGSVSGKVYLDTIKNCSADPLEPSIASRLVRFTPGPYYSTTDNQGNYSALLPYGTYSASTISNQNYTNVCQVNGINLSALNNNIASIDLGDSTGYDLDLEVNLTATAARPGFSYTLYATVKNNSTFSVPGASMVLDYNSILTFISSASSYNVTGPSQLTVSLPIINAFGTVVSAFTFNIPPDPQLIGSILSNQATLNANQPEPNTANNLALHQQVITGSFDPNEKSVWPAWDPNHYFFVNTDNEFRYTIQFQNTGNDTAFTVMLVDTLNPYLKISSFEMLGSSHPCRWEITGSNILKVHYDNILLPDSTTNEPGSHGLFSFRIRPTSSLQQVSLPYTLENRAAIYFDFNPPIITNTAFNTITITVGSSEISGPRFQIVPNPADNFVQIRFTDPEENWTVSLMDLSGRKLIRKNDIKGQVNLDISELSAGMYLVLVQSKNFSRMEKLIKK